MNSMLDESTILMFQQLLENINLSGLRLATISSTLARQGLMLKTGAGVNATLIAAPNSTNNVRASVTLRCTKPRRVNSRTLG